MAHVEQLENKDLYHVQCPYCNDNIALGVGPSAFDENLVLHSDVYCDNCDKTFRPSISEENLKLLRPQDLFLRESHTGYKINRK